MQQRITSTFGFIGSVVAAALAAAVMTGSARAEGPIEQTKPFVGSLSRAEVQAQVTGDRRAVTSYASEYALQHEAPASGLSGYTREQARAAFIASREEVRAMTAEDGGSSHIARMQVRTAPIAVAAVSEPR